MKPENSSLRWSRNLGRFSERPQPIGYPGTFDAFHAVKASIGKICLVRFDNNKYSVLSTVVGRPAEIQACRSHHYPSGRRRHRPP
ncbi:Mu transposase domain-containing protein [Agrobacterium tumefaciens]|uniref:Mu transposase domain-containing protein n=1 Tax=Agrobacterium tumefaciens TaxID=358 RepID=UPI003AF5C7AD